MSEDEELARIRFHWHSYVVRGGICRPKKSYSIGELKPGGLEHWTQFLILGRTYLSKYPKNRHLVENFVPAKTVKLLVGE